LESRDTLAIFNVFSTLYTSEFYGIQKRNSNTKHGQQRRWKAGVNGRDRQGRGKDDRGGYDWAWNG